MGTDKVRRVTAIQDLPEFGKFRVHLNCGHSILYDHTVDAVDEYIYGPLADAVNLTVGEWTSIPRSEELKLICPFCKKRRK